MNEIQQKRPKYRGHKPAPFLPGLVNSATSIGSRKLQQDACFHVSLPGAKVIIVADGLGESRTSQVIANNAILSALGRFQFMAIQGNRMNEAVLQWAISTAHSDAQLFNEALVDQELEPGKSTLLIGVETEDCFYFIGVGDGAVAFVSADGNVGQNHIVGNKLTGSIGSDVQLAPIFMTFPKTEEVGNCLVVASDGIATALRKGDDYARGPNEMRTIHYIFQGITQLLSSPNWRGGDDIQALLETWVRGEVAEIQDGSEVRPSADNRSIGVLIDQVFIDRWVAGGAPLLP